MREGIIADQEAKLTSPKTFVEVEQEDSEKRVSIASNFDLKLVLNKEMRGGLFTMKSVCGGCSCLTS
jgi:hypothetical protein